MSVTTLSAQINHLTVSKEETDNESLSMEELNHTLKLDYILAHEPFDELGWQYFPIPEFDLKPPIFDYAIALTLDEMKDYFRAHLPDSEKMLFEPNLNRALCRLNDMFSLHPLLGISDSVPITRK
ncbi:hypothetical protein E1B28_007114 [Marasmius oreades]|uniref:Uncharacterized protein n=1 Tax=Marasmius oreades TaxID=181124 RepID=A0A9P7S186_9AGAR|nr:uncharacterized protein E1B28_007114 [Marasmius oreades]KAG7093435.1 hypothetical protein E1B28_007114 [Marasmius oreades]